MMNWQGILLIVVPLGSFLAWIYSRLDKRFDAIDSRFEKVDTRFEKVEKELSQLNTRVAIVESKLSDISTNVTYLMWHHQTIQKDINDA